MGTKSKDRVPSHYREGSEDWQAEYDMLLDDGVTCGECVHLERCSLLFGGNASNTRCDFHPNRFYPRGGDCNRCGAHRSMHAKAKGVRVPGGFGKCVRPGGHCNPVKPALGIGGQGSNWKKR
jgi:hypothetical protein